MILNSTKISSGGFFYYVNILEIEPNSSLPSKVGFDYFCIQNWPFLCIYKKWQKWHFLNISAMAFKYLFFFL